MRDPEDLLRSLPPESPPAEVVLAAIRVFRYRAIVAIVLACALVLSAVILKGHLDRDARLLERIGRIRYTTGGVMTPNKLRDIDGIKVLLWEVVVDEADAAYVHVLAWDRTGRHFSLVVSDPEADGKPISLGAIEGSGGGIKLTHGDLWQEIRAPSGAEMLSFNVEVRSDEDGLIGAVPFEIHI